MPVIKLPDEEKSGKTKRIRADLQVDLERIQSHMQTKQFGTIPNAAFYYDKISEEELKKIDKKIGYIKEDYKDKDFEEMKDELQEMNASDTLKFILQDERTYKDINLQGPIERRKFYNKLINKLANKYINKKIFVFTCYRKKENKRNPDEIKREYTLCAYSYDGGEILPYLYSEKDNRFVSVSIQKLAELEKDGLVLGTRERTNGVKLLKKAIEKVSDNSHQEEVR